MDYFLYIAESKIKPPFWGINKNTVNRLNSQTIPYGIVMLNSNSISSYFMLSDIFNSIKDDLSTNANQYLLTPTYLCEEEEFITIEELKNKLLSAF